MKIYLFATFFIFSISGSATAQKAALVSAADLELNWMQTNDKDEMVLTVKNNGKVSLPAAGWKIFFNSRAMKTIGVDSLLAKITLVNGALFQLSPLPSFKAIAPAEAVKLHIATETIYNVSERPSGFYLVWDKTPDQGAAIKNVEFQHLAARLTFEQELSKKVYEENKKIKDIPVNQLPLVFPTPADYSPGKGTFRLTREVNVVGIPAFANEASLLTQDITRVLGEKTAGRPSAVAGKIVFLKDEKMAEEAYALTISPNQITIAASDPAGAFYAIQSLKSMFPASSWSKIEKSIAIPAAVINDHPRFGFRGFMMDVGRNFQPKSEVLKALDLMALYKLNVFHFHLTEDEGWRLEIPGLPELTTVGAARGHSVTERAQILPAYGSGPITGLNSGTGFLYQSRVYRNLEVC
ncbi:carbohydate-binding domain-containing protein [Pedobacter sp. N36a]|uniref:family 20 glycosylhydrolase n=1 Tax=Pedobacter sp. N36a TaxID=2767996 RepID=UPI00165696F5|nr:family 20 glycosylhydrolase [Pedobacter sp. N36a]MBC8984282.1 carbohydate-binding domain-containing protein [Pedobacter sp. N36a]